MSQKDDIALAYRHLVEQPAWKYVETMLDRLVADSDKAIDEQPIKELTVADVAQARGIRYAVGKIRRHVQENLNGGLQ